MGLPLAASKRPPQWCRLNMAASLRLPQCEYFIWQPYLSYFNFSLNHPYWCVLPQNNLQITQFWGSIKDHEIVLEEPKGNKSAIWIFFCYIEIVDQLLKIIGETVFILFLSFLFARIKINNIILSSFMSIIYQTLLVYFLTQHLSQ